MHLNPAGRLLAAGNLHRIVDRTEPMLSSTLEAAVRSSNTIISRCPFRKLDPGHGPQTEPNKLAWINICRGGSSGHQISCGTQSHALSEQLAKCLRRNTSAFSLEKSALLYHRSTPCGGSSVCTNYYNPTLKFGDSAASAHNTVQGWMIERMRNFVILDEDFRFVHHSADAYLETNPHKFDSYASYPRAFGPVQSGRVGPVAGLR
jgi:hypothetical protein